jgi:hypothetical protein
LIEGSRRHAIEPDRVAVDWPRQSSVTRVSPHRSSSPHGHVELSRKGFCGYSVPAFAHVI